MCGVTLEDALDILNNKKHLHLKMFFRRGYIEDEIKKFVNIEVSDEILTVENIDIVNLRIENLKFDALLNHLECLKASRTARLMDGYMFELYLDGRFIDDKYIPIEDRLTTIIAKFPFKTLEIKEWIDSKIRKILSDVSLLKANEDFLNECDILSEITKGASDFKHVQIDIIFNDENNNITLWKTKTFKFTNEVKSLKNIINFLKNVEKTFALNQYKIITTFLY